MHAVGHILPRMVRFSNSLQSISTNLQWKDMVHVLCKMVILCSLMLFVCQIINEHREQ